MIGLTPRPRVHHVGKRDAIDINVVRLNGAGRAKSNLPGERDVLVFVVVRNELKGILRAQSRDRTRHAVAGDTDATDEHAVLVKRNTARRAIQR